MNATTHKAMSLLMLGLMMFGMAAATVAVTAPTASADITVGAGCNESGDDVGATCTVYEPVTGEDP